MVSQMQMTCHHAVERTAMSIHSEGKQPHDNGLAVICTVKTCLEKKEKASGF